MNFDLDEITEAWIADRRLPKAVIQQLKEAHQENCAGVSSVPYIAPGNYCTELDLPEGSTWPEVIASLLDACINPIKQTYLREVQS